MIKKRIEDLIERVRRSRAAPRRAAPRR